jgi:hypothetical protein
MIEKRYYNATTLQDALAQYESAYGMTSAKFFEAHCADADLLKGMSGFQRSVWAGFWRESREFDSAGCAVADPSCDEFHSFELSK